MGDVVQLRMPSPVALETIAKLRDELGTPKPEKPKAPSAFAPENISWWAGLSDAERRFLCDAAKVARALAGEDWSMIDARERGALANAATIAAGHFADKRRALL